MQRHKKNNHSTTLSDNAAWLSNGSYRVFLTRRGTGFSAYRDTLLTAWEADPVEDGNGFFIYVRDLDSGEFWTASSAPLPHQAPGSYETSGGHCGLRRSHDGIATRLEVIVPEDASLELRRLGLHNCSGRPRRLEITSYIEAVLNRGPAHASHPAFSKLFVQTEWQAGCNALIARRRPRANSEKHPCMVHALLGAVASEYETDRVRFLGRGRDWTNPQALSAQSPLSGTVGNVLDPILSLRTIVSLRPDASLNLTFLLGTTDQHERWPELLAACPAAGLTARFDNAGAGSETLQQALSGPLAGLWRTMTAGFGTVEDAAPRRAPAAIRPASLASPATPAGATEPLQFFNGLGGFSGDCREYVIRLERDDSGQLRLPPMPWTNVMSNLRCGFLVSEKGASTVWSRNSREHRLTPWRNDPVSDPHDEALYIRDEENGEFWSPLPGPCPGQGDYEVRHGFGYSLWRHRSHELAQEVCLFVPRTDPLRIARISLTNLASTPRRLSVYAYQRWVLGMLPEHTGAHIVTEYAAGRQALLARNPAAGAFADGIAFAAVAAATASAPAGLSWTCDRAAFLGYGGSPRTPAALLAGGPLNGSSGTGGHPCAALRIEIELAPGASTELAFLLGETTSEEELDSLLAAYRRVGTIDRALIEVRDFWTQTVERVSIHTPVPAIDLMANGWLAYQNLVCRLWARTAFYQSGGAYGFRDQLQDSAALIYLRPDLTRRQILENAAHQFVEGDVLHWWHPPLSSGMRTRFADDLLWLPYLTAFYVRSTGDAGILDESARFIAAPLLEADEEEVFLTPTDSGQSADLYEHCCRALDRSLIKGAHGLPLFGCGDWNDGMNRVGHSGGESVWMGFFLAAIIEDFLPICEARQDAGRATRYRAYRAEMLTTLNAAGWDGEWYRRAYYADGTPLGSRASDECQIDALAQAWAVISHAAPEDRADAALDALEQHLISDDDKLIRLLTPPFVDTRHDPGYIKGYVAGVRENGGQYTHAALWVVKAMAEAGRRDRAGQLLEMLSPVSHAGTPEDVERYKIEPYVIAADIYGVAPHVGRGGWSWYTGSAGWMYRVTLESVLGFTLENGSHIRLAPRIPDAWPGFTIDYRLSAITRYRIEVDNPHARAEIVLAASLDGKALARDGQGVLIPLLADATTHLVKLTLGPRG